MEELTPKIKMENAQWWKTHLSKLADGRRVEVLYADKGGET